MYKLLTILPDVIRRPEFAWIFAHTYIQNIHPCVDSVCTWHRERKGYYSEKLFLSLEEISGCFWLESTACFAWMMVKALSLSTNTSPWISPVDWATSSVQGQQGLTVEQSENNATRQTSRESSTIKQSLRLQIWETKVEFCSVYKRRWDLHFFSRYASTKCQCIRCGIEYQLSNAV